MSELLTTAKECTAEAVQATCATQWRDALRLGSEPVSVSRAYRGGLPDSTTVFIVRDARARSLAVVLCSPPAAPNIVARSMQRTADANQVLGPRLGARVLQPLASSEIGGVSCALMPFCVPMATSRPLVWWHNRRLQPLMFEWLGGVLHASLRQPNSAEIASDFEGTIERLAQLDAASVRIRTLAERALVQLRSGRWLPKKTLMHGDLWRGNLMVRSVFPGQPRERWRDRIVVIDWAGSRVDGYPLFDLIRIAESTHASARSLATQVARHCQELRCNQADAFHYLMAALAYILQTLEHFPMHKFLAMCESSIGRLEAAIDHAT